MKMSNAQFCESDFPLDFTEEKGVVVVVGNADTYVIPSKSTITAHLHPPPIHTPPERLVQCEKA